LRLDDRTLISVVPVIPRGEWASERRVDRCTTYIGQSKDGGKTWRTISTLPYYSAVPWWHDGTLYVFAMKGGVKLLNQSRDMDGNTGWMDVFDGAAVDEKKVDEYIGRAVSRDPDVWVVEVEDALGANPFEGKIF